MSFWRVRTVGSLRVCLLVWEKDLLVCLFDFGINLIIIRLWVWHLSRLCCYLLQAATAASVAVAPFFDLHLRRWPVSVPSPQWVCPHFRHYIHPNLRSLSRLFVLDIRRGLPCKKFCFSLSMANTSIAYWTFFTSIALLACFIILDMPVMT